MAGTFPSTIRPASIILRSVSPSLVSTAHSLQRQVRSRGAHRWMLTYRFDPMKRTEWAEIVGFLDEQDGQVEKFYAPIFGKESPLGGVSGSPKVNGAHSAGARSISIKDLPLSTTGVFKGDDLVTFASHLKLYTCTRTVNSNGSGVATIYLNCPLQAALANNEAVTWQNVAMQASKVDDNVEREWKGGLVCPGFEVVMIEDPLA